jgi:hypothetical protein
MQSLRAVTADACNPKEASRFLRGKGVVTAGSCRNISDCIKKILAAATDRAGMQGRQVFLHQNQVRTKWVHTAD